MDQGAEDLFSKIKYIQDTLFVISGKWKLPILVSMYAGTNRFREIQRNVPGLSSRVLSRELKTLEENNLITRTVVSTSPMIVEYELTEYSCTLEPLAEIMADWGKNHRKQVTGK